MVTFFLGLILGLVLGLILVHPSQTKQFIVRSLDYIKQWRS